jgi:hypothetical protein
MEMLLPDAALRETFVADLKPLPLAYFEEEAPLISLPETIPCGYLRLSDAYDSEADEAEARHWHVRHEALNHLAPLTDPKFVAETLQSLIAAF